jgi:hypothetical protein
MGSSISNERHRYGSRQDGEADKELYDHQTDPSEQTNLAADLRVIQVKAGWLIDRTGRRKSCHCRRFHQFLSSHGKDKKAGKNESVFK